MARDHVGLPDDVYDYLIRVGVREPEILARLRDETRRHPRGVMQVPREEGALLRLLAELVGARRCLEIGTFTGYSSLSVALALPPDGRIVCCDVSEEFTSIARRYWEEAGVSDKVDLRLGPAVDTLDALLGEGAEGTFDMAFIDADKGSYSAYWERCVPARPLGRCDRGRQRPVGRFGSRPVGPERRHERDPGRERADPRRRQGHVRAPTGRRWHDRSARSLSDACTTRSRPGWLCTRWRSRYRRARPNVERGITSGTESAPQSWRIRGDEGTADDGVAPLGRRQQAHRRTVAGAADRPRRRPERDRCRPMTATDLPRWASARRSGGPGTLGGLHLVGARALGARLDLEL